jgi:nucleotide-binding universal stress UspA family protein
VKTLCEFKTLERIKPMFKKILLAADGSDPSLKAARLAAALARQFDGEVSMLHVFDPAVVPVPFAGVPDLPLSEGEDMGRYAAQVRAEVERKTTPVLEEYNVRYTTLQELGHPVDRIVSVAQDEKPDVIVLGSRGWGAVKSRLLGSVSDGVLHHAHCPVLIAR